MLVEAWNAAQKMLVFSAFFSLERKDVNVLQWSGVSRIRNTHEPGKRTGRREPDNMAKAIQERNDATNKDG